MPEGDTIHRTARTLRAALEGKRLTGVATTVPQLRALGVDRLLGQTVAQVEARGKHLLTWFAPSELALHTHLRMHGSWHVYRPGERWRKPERLARVHLDTADVVAVCFSAPVVALLTRPQVEAHPSIARLGPDALSRDVDLDEARRRLDARADATVGEALLDQSVLAGVGNVYKCEVLFVHAVDPWSAVSDLPAEVRAELLRTAVDLLRANVAPGQVGRITTNGGRRGPGPRLHVYGRAGRPCPRCATPIRVSRQGVERRLTYWCSRCQGPGAAGG